MDKEIGAFEKWFHREYMNDVNGGAHYLYKCLREAGADNVVWKYITPSTGYSANTFINASKVIIGTVEEYMENQVEDLVARED